MLPRLLRGLLYLVYALVVVLTFTLAAYVSFSLFVRSGLTTVPQLKGLTRAEAANRLADQGLRLRNTEKDSGRYSRYDDEVPIGRVVQQDPDPRTPVKRGSSVELVISKGPQRIEVPKLAGQGLPAAQAALSGSGLALGRTLMAFAAGKTEGSVLGSDPGEGDAVAPATPVHLLLAMAPPRERFIMPDLVYRNYDQVRPYLESKGLGFGSVRFERYEGVAGGVILRQFPLPGHPVTRQDAISLVVATAESLPETVP